MKKQKDSLSNTKIAIVFFILLVFFVGLSLAFKLVLVVRAGQFDSSKRFNLTLLNNKNLEVMSLGPAEKNIAVFKLNRSIGGKEAGKFLGVPIDGFLVCDCLDLNQKPDSIFLKAIFNYKKVQTNLTVIDLVKLLVFSRTIAPSSVATKNIDNDLITAVLDKVIIELASDELIEKDNQTIQIINGTDIAGLGNRLARLVTNMGGDVIIVATSQSPRKVSNILYIDQKTYTIERLSKVLGYPVIRDASNAISDITIIIGEDKVDSSPF